MPPRKVRHWRAALFFRVKFEPMTLPPSNRITRLARSPLVLILIALAAILLLTRVGPVEKSLGVNIRVVYLHGAWVWASLALFIAAGLTGLAAILVRPPERRSAAALHAWSRALGRAGLVFWITYLPISMWAMQTNWNGLYLAEPRWRLALIYAISGLLLQIGLSLIANPFWTSLANLLFISTLLIAINSTREIMHPSSPILSSDSRLIQVYFFLLVGVTLLAAWQVARLFLRLDPPESAVQ